MKKISIFFFFFFFFFSNAFADENLIDFEKWKKNFKKEH